MFCAGDAVHRHPPTNGLGSNTSIQDSYNLAWKLAHVVAGTAAPSLLDSYDVERGPVARQIVERANQSIADTGKILTALDLTDTTDVARLEEQLALRKAPGPEGEKIRAALREAIAYKAYEFDAHGVEHNHRYASAAVLRTARPAPSSRRDPRTVRPAHHLARRQAAAHLGHRARPPGLHARPRRARAVHRGHRHRRPALAGRRRRAGRRLGMTITPMSIGPGQPYEDPYGTWAGAARDRRRGRAARPARPLHRGPPPGPPRPRPAQAHDWLAAALSSVLGRPSQP